MYHVDFNDVARTRTPKSHFTAYQTIIKDNGFPSEVSLPFTGLEPSQIVWQDPVTGTSMSAVKAALPASSVPSQASVSVWQVNILAISIHRQLCHACC